MIPRELMFATLVAQNPLGAAALDRQSTAGPALFELVAHVGQTFLGWFDDPDALWMLGRWRQRSLIVSIEPLPDTRQSEPSS